MSNQIYQEIRENLETKLRSISQFTDQQIKEKGFDPLSYRLFLMENINQEKIEFSWQKLEQTQKRLWEMRKMSAMIRDFDHANYEDGNYGRLYLLTSYLSKWEKPEKIVLQQRQMIEMLDSGSNLPNFIKIYEQVITDLYNFIFELAVLDKDAYWLLQIWREKYWIYNELLYDFDFFILKLQIAEYGDFMDIPVHQLVWDWYDCIVAANLNTEPYIKNGHMLCANGLLEKIQKLGWQVDDYSWGWGLWSRGN